MTPEEIRSQRFGSRLLGGLSKEEVSAFLEDVAEVYENLQTRNGSLRTRVEALEAEIQTLATRQFEAPGPNPIEALRAATLRELEALLHDAQSKAQTLIDGARETEATILRDAEAAKARMQAEGEAQVARATEQAESLIATAREQETAIRSEIDRLAQSRLQLVDDIRGALDTYQGWLASVDPRGRARGRRKAVGAPNGGDESAAASDEVRAAG